MRTVVRIMGWLLVAFGIIGVGVEIDHIRNRDKNDQAVGFALAAVCIVGGSLLIRSGSNATAKTKSRLQSTADGDAKLAEQYAFDVAKRRQGLVTAAMLAAESPLTFEEAQSELERLTKLGACQMDITDDGGIVFRFPDFMRPAAH